MHKNIVLLLTAKCGAELSCKVVAYLFGLAYIIFLWSNILELLEISDNKIIFKFNLEQ